MIPIFVAQIQYFSSCLKSPTMQKLMINQREEVMAQFKPIIEEVVMVGLNENCRCISDTIQFKWITSLQIVTQKQYQSDLFCHIQSTNYIKFVQMGNELYLKIWFCEKDKKPITKIKSSKRLSNSQSFPIQYPNETIEQEYLCYMVNENQNGKILIQDVEMVEIKSDNDLEMPQENNYEIVRLPTPCQKIQKQQCSNSEDQMLTKTRYLLVKFLDLEDQQHHHVQHFQPEVIFQHSMKNKSTLIEYKSFHFFCFPQGVPLYKKIIGYGYSIFNFILTQEDGTRIYVNCLKFKQKLQSNIVQTLPQNCIDKHIHNHQVLFTEKTLCLLSKYCYTDFFHNILEQLFRKYQTCQNKNHLKMAPYYQQESVQFKPILLDFIEKYQIGFRQCEKKFNQCEYLKEEIHLEIEWDNRKIVFPLPKQQLSSFYSPKAIHCLFKMLSIQIIIEIVEALLLQKTVIFVSHSQVAVGYAIESLVSFLYPLKWEHVILPILPYDMLKLVEAPMPLIAGIPTNLASDYVIHNLKQQSIIVFLDCNDVLHIDSIRETFDVNHFKQAVKKLRVYDIYVKSHVNQMLQYRDQFYLFKIYERQQSHFCAEHIKHIFFEMILRLLQNYHLYYSKNCNSPTKGSTQSKAKINDKNRPFNFKKDYNLEQFVRSHPKSNIKFMRKFTQSAHFIHFLYQYYDNDQNPSKSFIDSALKRQNSNLSQNYLFQNRYSEQAYNNNLEVNNLKKKISLPTIVHNATWSPPSKKLEEIVEANYTSNGQKNFIKAEDVELEREKQEIPNQDVTRKRSTGGNICEAITKAMMHVSNTKNNLFMWTAARVTRLKKQYLGHQQKDAQEQVEKLQKIEKAQIRLIKQPQEQEKPEQPQKKAY